MRFICCILVFLVQGLSFSQSEDVNWMDMRDRAIRVGNILQQNKDLARKVPTLANFFMDVASNTELLSNNSAVAASTIYMTGMLATMYNSCLEVKSQLQRAQFKDEDIKLIIETEIPAIIQLLEKVVSSGNQEGFCSLEVKERFKIQLDETAYTLKYLRVDIIAKIDELSAAGSTTNGIGVYGILAILAILVAAYFGMSSVACLLLFLGAGAAIFGTSMVGLGGFTSNKLTHEEILIPLNTSRLTVYKVEKICRMARATIEATCTEFALDDGVVDVNNMMKELDGFIPKKKKTKSDPLKTIYNYFYNCYYNWENISNMERFKVVFIIIITIILLILFSC